MRHVEGLANQDQRGQRDHELVASLHQELPQVQQAGGESQWLQPCHVQMRSGRAS